MAVKFTSNSARLEYYSDGTNNFVLTNGGLLLNISGAGLSLDFVKIQTSVDSSGDWVTIQDENTTLQILFSETIFPNAAALVAALQAIISTTLQVTVNIDLPNCAPFSTVEANVAVPGAVDGNGVVLGVPNVCVPAPGKVGWYYAWVSAPDVVTVRFWNDGGGPFDPPAGNFQITVIKQ